MDEIKDSRTQDFTSTTIYYDGQFWSALIEKKVDGIYYSGRYVFGAEPANPRLLYWMLYEYDQVPLYKTLQPVKIKFKKSNTSSDKSITKSLDAYKNAQAHYFEKIKTARRVKIREDKQRKWELKRESRKEKKRH